MATHSNILAWKIPWTEKLGRLHIVHEVSKSQTQLNDWAHTYRYRVSPLHMNLQVVNFQRWECLFASLIISVSSFVWHALSHACILHNRLYFCVLYCIVLYRVQQKGIFISSPGSQEASVKVANCVSWVSRLTLLGLWTNWTSECALVMELVWM